MENADDVEVLENSHQIQNRYTFWYRNAKASANYNESIKKIASFQSVEHFWRIYDYLKRPKDLHFTEYHLFKDGIFPTWEDPQNKAGGKWMIRLKKGISSRYWEDVILAIIGEQFDVGSEICGAVLSIRSNEDILSVWNKTADNLEAVNKIRDQLRRLLRLPNVIVIEYKRHQDSLVDKSSYRNPTMVWRAPARTTTDKPHGFSNYNAAPNKPAWKGRNAEEGVSTGGAPAGGTTSGYRGSTGNAWNKTASTGEAPAPVPRGRSDSQEGAHNTRVAGAGGWQRGQAAGTTATPTGTTTTAATTGNVSSATAVLQGAMGLNKSKPAGAVAPPVTAAPVGNAWARKGPAI